MKKYKCFYCGKVKVFDPRKVSTQCPHCNAFLSFLVISEKAA